MLHTHKITTRKRIVGLMLLTSLVFVALFSLVQTDAALAAPTVNSTVPANGATNVSIGNSITATFSETMNPLTITTGTFIVTKAGMGPGMKAPVLGTVTYSGVTAIFTPAVNLLPSTTYTATITTGARNLAGNALSVNKVWSFTTGAALDIIAPTVILTDPANGDTDAAFSQRISVTFSEAMNPLTITTGTFIVTKGSMGPGMKAPVLGTVTYFGVTAVFTPAVDLLPSTTYTATITTGARDLAGNALSSNKVWSFTTGNTLDIIAPTVILTDPANGDTNVALSKRISATFSKTMDPTTITNISFTLTDGITPVTGTVTYVGLTATFTPNSYLSTNTTYTATITTGAEDLADNPLAINEVWSFTTVATTGAGPLPVDLGTAGNFVILAKSGISTTGTTAVVGDMGLSPAAASFITGFGLIADSTNTFSTSSLVTGKIHAANYAPPTPAKMTTAVSDMETAFTDAAGRTLPDFTELGAGNISGITLVPGLYKWGTGVLITSGVTLSGGANDVWIFQIAADLTVSNSAIVTLSGGAQPKNIFWQVSGQATLGTYADFEGIILSHTLISLNTGAVMNGRALAQTAVTLNATAITAP